MSGFSGFPAGTATFLRRHHREQRQGVVRCAPRRLRGQLRCAGQGLRRGDRAEASRDFAGRRVRAQGERSIFRINRDVRFSRDKRPYRNHLDLWFWHGAHRGSASPGFFFRMYSDRLILGAGMHQFEKPQLEAYRRAVVEEGSGEFLARASRWCGKPAPTRSAARPAKRFRVVSTLLMRARIFSCTRESGRSSKPSRALSPRRPASPISARRIFGRCGRIALAARRGGRQGVTQRGEDVPF